MKNKICPTCRVEKAPEEFGRRSGRPTTLNSKCYLCQTLYKRQWARQHQETYRAYKFKSRYGISIDEYNRIATQQDGACAICLVIPKKLVVDHDHKTKRIRGLICNDCNLMLGHAKDSTSTLQSALEYL